MFEVSDRINEASDPDAAIVGLSLPRYGCDNLPLWVYWTNVSGLLADNLVVVVVSNSGLNVQLVVA